MRVLIASGGTGGHLYPAILMGKELEREGFSILFTVGKRKIEEKIVRKMDVKYKTLPLLPPSSPFHYVSIILSTIEAIFIIKNYKPDKILGTGSYTSFPILFWAKILGIPIYLHEQNTIPGKVTKIFSKCAKKVFVSFPETKRYINASKVIFTGLPVRENGVNSDYKKVLLETKFDKNKPIFMAFGGSQGSYNLLKMLKVIENKIQSLGLQGVIIKGSVKMDFKYSFTHVLKDYIHDILSYYKISDFVIARGGASTIWELIKMKKPGVIIPIKGNLHQLKNAKFFEEIGGGYVVEEKDTKSLIDSIHLLIENKENLKKNLETFNIPDWRRILREEIRND